MDHNQSTNFNMTTAHAQAGNNDLPFNNFIDDSQAYADEPPSNNEDYMSWDPALFISTDHASTTQQHQQPTTASQIYSHNVSRQSASPALPQYGTAQQSYQNQYPQQSFDQSQIPQSLYNTHFLSQTSPSPGPYSTQYSMQQPMGFPSREQTLHSPQPFSNHPGNLPPRPSSTVNQNFAAQSNTGPSQYFTYAARGMQYPGIQNRDMQHMNSFPEQVQQTSNHFVDPSMLIAGDMSHVLNVRDNAYLQPFQARQQYGNSPYLPSISPADPRVQQPYQHSSQLAPQNPAAQSGVLLPPKPAKPIKPKTPKDPNAPKRPRGRPRKDGAVPRVKKEGQESSSSSDSDSDDGLEVVEAPPDPPPALLVVGSPTDLGGKALYDAVKAVWSPGNKPAIGDNIRSGVKLFGEAVKSLRDAWKIKNESLRKAELPNGGDPEVAAGFKTAVARLRQNMETLMQRSLTFGHPAHLMSLGENPHTMSALYSFLLDRFTATDYDGSLVLSILKLVVKFTTMDTAMLEMTKNIKILEKLTKKANNEVKTLAQTILDNATAATAKKKANGAEQNVGSPASPRPSVDPAAKSQKPDAIGTLPRKDPVVGLKRPREPDTTSLPIKRPVTKPIPQASKPLAVQAAERRKAELAAQAQAIKSEKTTTSLNGTAAAVSKPKATVAVPPKPATNLFSTLQSASKKPGTSNAARAAAATKEKAAPVAKRESPPPVASIPTKPAFSFMDTLADMSKPKEVEQKKVEDLPPETEEERSRRLRKEARRKLRVSWKPDDSLVETRVFIHDPDEEVGHADSMMRDVSDIGGEGRMLKLHMDKKGLEDEDEDGEELEDYTAPTEVDFAELDAEERSRNYIKVGGLVQPESLVSQAQDRHEENTLMVVYALPSDVPSSPKEPPESADEDDYQPISEFGDPEQKTREREAKYLASRNDSQMGSSNVAVPDISAILQSIKPTQSQQSANIPSDLQRTLNMLSQQQQPQQPQAPTVPGIGLDINKLLAVANAHTQLQAQQQPQYTPAPPVAATPNLAALLAQMTQGQQPQALPIGLQGNPNPYPGADLDYSRKHSRTDSNGNEYDGDYNKSKNSNKKKKSSGGGGDTSKPYNYKTMTCLFWQKGQCTKGDMCTYKHEE